MFLKIDSCSIDLRGSSSLLVSPINNISASEELIQEFGEHPKDVQVFSQSRHQGTNICAKQNGGCQELCLFNGTHGVCVCTHGIVDVDGKTCKGIIAKLFQFVLLIRLYFILNLLCIEFYFQTMIHFLCILK